MTWLPRHLRPLGTAVPILASSPGLGETIHERPKTDAVSGGLAPTLAHASMRPPIVQEATDLRREA
jgi:hypothetical protein